MWPSQHQITVSDRPVEHLAAKESDSSLRIWWSSKTELKVESILDLNSSGGQRHNSEVYCLSVSAWCNNIDNMQLHKLIIYHCCVEKWTLQLFRGVECYQNWYYYIITAGANGGIELLFCHEFVNILAVMDLPPVSMRAHLHMQLSLSMSLVLKSAPWITRLLCLPAVPLWLFRNSLKDIRRREGGSQDTKTNQREERRVGRYGMVSSISNKDSKKT